jgi:hypothetical protein
MFDCSACFKQLVCVCVCVCVRARCMRSFGQKFEGVLSFHSCPCLSVHCSSVCVCARAFLNIRRGVLMVQVPQQMAGNAEEAAVLTDANDTEATDATDGDTHTHTVSPRALN